MLAITNRVKEIAGLSPDSLTDEILTSSQPLLLKNLVDKWPVVHAGRESALAANSYLRKFSRDAVVRAMLGKPDIKGRFFYNENLSGFNFMRTQVALDKVLDELNDKLNDMEPPAIYVGSASIDLCLPGFRTENDINLGDRDPIVSIWIGNRTRIAAHHDFPHNIACIVAGRRRFTLFPPEQISNLYVGPLDLTPAGQAISLVDFMNPDFSRFPKFKEALQHAEVAEMEPGDALFIPSSWWHHVEALESFNVLVNYWWCQSPAYIDPPMNALTLAMMTVRDLPPAQRKAWEAFFRHYVFEAGEDTTDHIPASARGSLGTVTPDMMRMMRAQLLKKLNR